MINKHHIKILEIRKTIAGEQVLYQYIPDPNDPKHDDLPSETLKEGEEYNVDFTPIKPDPEEEFNIGDKKN